MRTCPRCTTEKSETDFGVNRATPTGRHYICKECNRAARKKYYAANPEQERQKRRDYRTTHLEKERVRDREYQRALHGHTPNPTLGMSPRQRWEFYIQPGNADECWKWQGGFTGAYGMFWNGHRRTRAHVAGYELLIGPVPDGIELHHTCLNPACVNPSHLEPLTPSEHQRLHWKTTRL